MTLSERIEEELERASSFLLWRYFSRRPGGRALARLRRAAAAGICLKSWFDSSSLPTLQKKTTIKSNSPEEEGKDARVQGRHQRPLRRVSKVSSPHTAFTFDSASTHKIQNSQISCKFGWADPKREKNICFLPKNECLGRILRAWKSMFARASSHCDSKWGGDRWWGGGVVWSGMEWGMGRGGGELHRAAGEVGRDETGVGDVLPVSRRG